MYLPWLSGKKKGGNQISFSMAMRNMRANA